MPDGPAAVVDATIATLRSALPAAIAAFNTSDNGVTLEEPRTYAFGADEPLGSNGFPVVEVALIAGQLTGFPLGNQQADHAARLNICVWTEGATGDLEQAMRASYGLGWCVLRVLVPTFHAFGPNAQLPGGQDAAGGISWVTDAVPDPPHAEPRDVKKWRVPLWLSIDLSLLESFS